MNGHSTIIAYHNVQSQVKLEEFARVAIAFKPKLLVISRAIGSAAQGGIPSISRLAFERDCKVLIVRELEEAIELLNPEEVLIFSDEAEEEFSGEVKDNAMLVFFGAFPIEKEKKLGKTFKISPKGIGEIGKLAIAMERIRCRVSHR